MREHEPSLIPEVEPENNLALQQRIEDCKRILDDLWGEAWIQTDGPELLATKRAGLQWTVIPLEEKFLHYDPDRIEILDLSVTANLGEMENQYRDWRYVGKDDQKIYLARPHFKELPSIPRVPGVSIETASKKYGINILRVDTLDVELYPATPVLGMDLSQLTEHLDEIVLVDIRRNQLESGENSLQYQGRNPHIAKLSLLREMRLIGLQLQELGFRKAISQPTDKRREKVYRHVFGMQDSPFGSDTLICSVDKLVMRRPK